MDEEILTLTNSMAYGTRRFNAAFTRARKTPGKMFEWCLPGRRKKGRPRNSWMQDLITGMREKGIDNMEWIDREEWRSKIKL